MEKRRGRGEGSIFQRADGRWSAVVNIGKLPTGARIRRTVYAATKREVQEKKRRLELDISAGVVTDAPLMTVREFLARWMEAAKQTLRASTLRTYSVMIEHHALPAFGSVQIAKLQPLHIQALHAKMEKAGNAPATRRQMHSILHRAFSQAVKWGNLARNPVAAVDRPKPQRKAMEIWDLDEVDRFMTAIAEDRQRALYIMALTTGARQGELFGLHWEDVDLTAGSVAIRYTLSEVGKEQILSAPKTGKARVVPLEPIAITALKRHREKMLAEGFRGGLVFRDSEGNAVRRANLVNRSFAALCTAAGVKRIRFHDLRHTAASLMMYQGVPLKVIQERLGHASLTITMDVYAHLLPSMQAEASVKMDAFWTARGHT